MLSTSPMACCVLSASFLTSSATTAKPLPASPARAASIAAFNASKFVWSAISLITFKIFPIWAELSDKCCIVSDKDIVSYSIICISLLTLSSFSVSFVVASAVFFNELIFSESASLVFLEILLISSILLTMAETCDD